MIPFLQTMAVLVNSILLVCISLDRYMAVSRIIKGSWEPSKVFTVTCCVLIWGFSAAVSSPLLTIYDFYRIYVVPLPDPNEENPVLRYYVAHLCGSDKVSLDPIHQAHFHFFAR
jgi:7 transmembrane receptor (rhodopsin family)